MLLDWATPAVATAPTRALLLAHGSALFVAPGDRALLRETHQLSRADLQVDPDLGPRRASAAAAALPS